MSWFARNEQQPVAESSALQGDLKTVRKSAARTAFLATALVSGITPLSLLAWDYQSSTTPLVHQLRQMWAIVVHTYPLTLAIGLVILSRYRKWFGWGKWFCYAAILILFTGLGNVIGSVTGLGSVQPVEVMDVKGLFAIPAAGLNCLAGFYDAYGLRTFVASVLVGTFAGSTANRMMAHVPTNREQAVELATGLAQSTFGSNRRAA